MENADSHEKDRSSLGRNDPGSDITHNHEINEISLLHQAESLSLNDGSLDLRQKDGEGLNLQNSNNTEHQAQNSNEKQIKCESYDETENPRADLDDDGKTHVAGVSSSSPTGIVDPHEDVQAYAWPEKAVALKNFVKEKGAVAVSTVFRRLSGIKDDHEEMTLQGEDRNDDSAEEENVTGDPKSEAFSPRTWNPLSFIKISWDADTHDKTDAIKHAPPESPKQETANKGRIIVYTKLGCQDSKQVRLLLHQKGLKYTEINIDIYPSRKLELEKNTGSSSVPRVYFNDLVIGGLVELKALDESGKFQEKINYLVNEDPSPAAPLPPLPGEDDSSGSGTVDELANIVRKMKQSVVVKDRFYKMRWFSNCFTGSEAVEFLSEDQYLEKEEAVQFGRKLVESHFFHHVLNENIFEDGNHLYRFLEDDPAVTQCYNIPKVAIDAKPKPITEIAARLRILSYAMFEAYTSNDGRHVDYRSIHRSEEFKRYLRTISELLRVDLRDTSREEKLAFFINLYNMMVIHAILTWGYPTGTLERRNFFGDFKYIIGGCTYSLSAIQNGILRGNQRPPYNLGKPFGPKDKRSEVPMPQKLTIDKECCDDLKGIISSIMVALSYPEPLIHFALVFGTRSGPALRCYSPGDIDKELIEAAHNFLRTGGLLIDIESKCVSISKILKWFSVDFGKNEIEVVKHAANYLEPSDTQALLELLANAHLKVTYQSYDWGLNH